MSNKSLALPHNELTILVTGGAGFIGSHTCIELLGQNYNVVIVDDLSNSSKIAVERIRELSMEAGRTVKVEGKDNDLLERIAADPAFNLSLEDLKKTMDPARYVGRAPLQVDNFLKNVVDPVLDANKELLGVKAEINV